MPEKDRIVEFMRKVDTSGELPYKSALGLERERQRREAGEERQRRREIELEVMKKVGRDDLSDDELFLKICEGLNAEGLELHEIDFERYCKITGKNEVE
jgi:hypothetical protein